MLGLFFVGIVVLLAVDQITKLIVLKTLTNVGTMPVLQNVFHLTYCENRGAAFGILQNQTWIFIIITVAVLVAVIYFMVRMRPKNLWLNFSLILLIGGALGNFVDRIFRGFVIDFLDFRIINFPIFNVADCFVVVGAILLGCYIIFSEQKKEKE